jgi:hypothetical protein
LVRTGAGARSLAGFGDSMVAMPCRFNSFSWLSVVLAVTSAALSGDIVPALTKKSFLSLVDVVNVIQPERDR